MNNIILRKLEKLGLQYKIVTINRPHGKAGSCDGIIVYHDYFGLYPNAETMRKHSAVDNLARAAGLKAEQRGHYTATLIYC